jgi:sodium-independent sulfate anion transporter 11
MKDNTFIVLLEDIIITSLVHLLLQYGLYGSFLGTFLYILFGSCKDVPMGPTAIVSLLTFQQVGNLGINNHYYAILLCFLAGCVEVLMGTLGLGECTTLFHPVKNPYSTFWLYRLWLMVWFSW